MAGREVTTMARTWREHDGKWFPRWEDTYTHEEAVEMDEYEESGWRGHVGYITFPPDADLSNVDIRLLPAWALARLLR
jgi:hypothetical protein